MPIHDYSVGRNPIKRLGSFLNKKKPIIFVLCLQFGFYIIAFSFVLAVALLNPKSFFHVMEVFTSLALNLESGVFIAVMLIVSRSRRWASLQVPVALPKVFIYSTFIFVAFYFLFACFYDVVSTLVGLFIEL